ncbi:unnamed protein product [Arctogadus glacialis]
MLITAAAASSEEAPLISIQTGSRSPLNDAGDEGARVEIPSRFTLNRAESSHFTLNRDQTPVSRFTLNRAESSHFTLNRDQTPVSGWLSFSPPAAQHWWDSLSLSPPFADMLITAAAASSEEAPLISIQTGSRSPLNDAGDEGARVEIPSRFTLNRAESSHLTLN